MCCLCRLIVLPIALLAALTAPTRADIVWESMGYADEQTIINGSVFTGADGVGNRVTFNFTIFSDSDGGTFDLGPGRNASFLSYESGITGNHTGYMEMSFDNQNDDPSDYLDFVIAFAFPTTNLQFSLLDVDAGAGNSFVDAIEVFYNGINVRTNPSLYSFGSSVANDNESYLTGFEGTGSAVATGTTGNINFDFGSTIVNSLVIRYRSSDDAQGNPVAQFIGISDLSFTTIPEPALAWVSSCLVIAGLLRRNRR
jgi:hypothetical protein